MSESSPHWEVMATVTGDHRPTEPPPSILPPLRAVPPPVSAAERKPTSTPKEKPVAKKRKPKGDSKAWTKRAVAYIDEHGPVTLEDVVDAVPGDLVKTTYARILRRKTEDGTLTRSLVAGSSRTFEYSKAPAAESLPAPTRIGKADDGPAADDIPTMPDDGPLVTLAVHADGVRMSHADAIRILAAMGGSA